VYRAAAGDKCGVSVEHCHGKIGDHPRVGSQRASLHVLHVLGLISHAAVRIYENSIFSFNALDGGDVFLFNYSWPVILNPHYFRLD